MNRRVVFASLALLLAAALSILAPLAGRPSGVDTTSWILGIKLLQFSLAGNAVLLFAAGLLAPKTGSFEPLLLRGLRAPQPAGARSRWILGALLVFAAALRLRALDQGLSFDEIDTLVHYTRKPLSEIATTFDSQNQHLLYSLCARPACLVFGDGAFGVRFPAVVFGVASIWALYRLALLVADRREALFAAALLVVSYHHIWFSQDARGYTGLLFFTLLGTELFLRMLSEREPRGLARAWLYGLWMALAALTHATAVVTVAAHFLIWLALAVRARGRTVGPNLWRPVMGFVFAGSLTFLFYALVLPQFFHTLLAPTMAGKATEWKQTSWLVSETLAGLSRGVPGGWPALALGGLVAVLGAWSYLRQSAAVLAAFLLGSVLMAAALVSTHHNLWPRMFFFGAGFFVLIALRGVVHCATLAGGKRASSVATIALVLACLMSAATLRYVWAPKQDFGGALEFLEAQRAPEDAIVTVGMTVMPYAELYGKNWPKVDNQADLAAIEALHPRTWIVYTTPTHMQAAFPDIWKLVQERYRSVETFWGTLAGCEVIVAMHERAN